jgi:hypothetical protein
MVLPLKARNFANSFVGGREDPTVHCYHRQPSIQVIQGSDTFFGVIFMTATGDGKENGQTDRQWKLHATCG